MRDMDTTLADHIVWFARWCRRKNLAPRTITTYVDHVTYLAEFLGDVSAAELTPRHIESYIDHLFDKGVKASTVAIRFRSLQQFCKYLVSEDEIAVSPMAKMTPPATPEQPVPVVDDDAFAKMITSIRMSAKFERLGPMSGMVALEARRDEAILRLFADTGVRLNELATLTVDCVDFDSDQITVLGKGRRLRTVPFDDDTAVALRKYLRERRNHPKARSSRFVNQDDPNDPRNGNEALWLGAKGALSQSGIAQMLARRSQAALGVRLHPHQIRHTAAHAHAKAGVSETDMMRLFGWKSDTMVKRYGASAAAERAREAKRTKGLGNRFKV